MTKAERTKLHILEKTAPLFNTKGFEGTTLTDLTEATGLTKGSLYGNFKDKEEIAIAVFHFSMEKVRAIAQEKLSHVDLYKDKLIAMLEFYSEYVMTPPIPGGCPLMNKAVEADDHHTSMKKAVAKEIHRTVDFMAELLSKGKRNREFRADIKPKELAFTFFCAIEGAIMVSRVSNSRDAMNSVVRHGKNILDQISK